MTAAQKRSNTAILKAIPSPLSQVDILNSIYSLELTGKSFNAIKELSNLNDEDVSSLMNISVRTLRSYRSSDTHITGNVKEHLIVLLSLMKHGNEVFGSAEAFSTWLQQSNFFLDGKKPERFLNTITGIQFIDDRLTALQYGDNA